MFKPVFASLVMAGLAAAVQAQPMAAAAGTPVDIPDWQYSVRPGDTLLLLAERYLVNPRRWGAVQRLNQIADPRRIPVGTVLRIPANELRSAPGWATVKAVHGPVRWRMPGTPWQTATVGQQLGAGAEVQTQENANAVLELANGTELALHAQSALALDTLTLYVDGLMADTRVRLQGGQTEIKDNPKRRDQQNLRITTPGAQATVRGTLFRVGVQGDATREETLEGAVELASGPRSVRVNPQQGSLARQGQAPTSPKTLLAAPDLSGWPAVVEQLPLTFRVDHMSGATQWWSQIGDSSFDTIYAQAQAPGDVISYADLPDGRYTVRVRGVDELGLSGLEARRAITVRARPFAPLLQQPGRAATVRQAKPTLQWTAAPDVTRYRVQLSGQANFDALLLDRTIDTTQAAVFQDLAGGLHHWRVASVDSTGQQGPWSTSSMFTYKPGPGPVDLGAAPVRFVGDSALIDLPAPPPGQHYQLALANSADDVRQTATAVSRDGKWKLPRPAHGDAFLAIRLVDSADGTEGPQVIHQFEVPWRYPQLWILLLPLLALL